MTKEFIIYADESTQRGRYYSNFYGGALIRSDHIDHVRYTLHKVKQEHNLYNEIKWSKGTSRYLEKYKSVMDSFFELIRQGLIKVRIMFTQNSNVPVGLDAYQRENSYHLLYYQFIKHAFGLSYCHSGTTPIYLRMHLDKIPDTNERNSQFKAYLLSLQYTANFRRAHIKIRPDQIVEIDSHQHDILQCLDVVLGAMQFRLNDQHKIKPVGAVQRGKRTIAKEKLYKHIRGHIAQIYPNFNIGVSTGIQGDKLNLWRQPYRHWLFVPRTYRRDRSRNKKAP
jgi:hypothetical protein